MVKELSVKVPKVSKWDDSRTFAEVMHEYVFQGVPLPDDLREYQREASGLEWLYRDRSLMGPSAVAAAMEWDAWHLEQEKKNAGD